MLGFYTTDLLKDSSLIKANNKTFSLLTAYQL